MARCQVIRQSWTLCGLVGAFLDLGITYFLLCCSTIAFFISNFLAFLGLSLPCPCNGLFGNPNHGYCAQSILVDYPTKSVSSLQLSVKSKFPFDAILARSDHCQLNLKLVKERKFDDGVLEFDGEASYSSFSDPRRSQHSLSGSNSIGKFDIRGKGAANQRARCGSLRRRRRRGTIDYGKFSSSSVDHIRSDVRAIRRSPSVPAKMGNELSVELSKPFNSDGRNVSDFESIDATDDGKLIYGNATYFENLKSSVRLVDGIGGEDESALRILEQALEEEQAARVALYSELEQERIAAATAADEAMAMISRLQEEKAAIEMEARQYQRILEEKSSYDAEEMEILKEIIVRREREKHFLERKVEVYRKVLEDDVELDNQVNDVQCQNASYLDSFVDPMLILQQLGQSIDKRGDIQRKHLDYASVSVEKQTVPSGKEAFNSQTKILEVLEHPESSRISPNHLPNIYESYQDVQEKRVLSVDERRYSQFPEAGSSFLEDNLALVFDENRNDNVCPLQKLSPGVISTDSGKQTLEQVGEPHVHDIHVISSKCDPDKMVEKGSDGPSFPRKQESSFEPPKEIKIIRTRSDTIDRLLSVNSSTSSSSASELRRNSLPTVVHERLKIDSEVEWLRSRLRTVQEEKEKLKSSLDRQERGKAELQLLEDIATRIWEIRHLTEPEKTLLRGSLPPLSSKVSSKMKRSRSISVGIGHSQSN